MFSFHVTEQSLFITLTIQALEVFEYKSINEIHGKYLIWQLSWDSSLRQASFFLKLSVGNVHRRQEVLNLPSSFGKTRRYGTDLPTKTSTPEESVERNDFKFDVTGIKQKSWGYLPDSSGSRKQRVRHLIPWHGRDGCYDHLVRVET